MIRTVLILMICLGSTAFAGGFRCPKFDPFQLIGENGPKGYPTFESSVEKAEGNHVVAIFKNIMFLVCPEYYISKNVTTALVARDLDTAHAFCRVLGYRRATRWVTEWMDGARPYKYKSNKRLKQTFWSGGPVIDHLECDKYL